MEAAVILSSEVGIKHACEALDVARAGFYRTQARKVPPLLSPCSIRPRHVHCLPRNGREYLISSTPSDSG